MLIIDLIEQIDRLVTGGAPISDIKPPLASLREHTEALVFELQACKSEIEICHAAPSKEDLQRLVDALKEENRKLKNPPAPQQPPGLAGYT